MCQLDLAYIYVNAPPGLSDLHPPPPRDHWAQPIFRFLSTQRRRNLERSFISTINATVHANPLRIQSFSKTLFRLEEFENAASLCVLSVHSF